MSDASNPTTSVTATLKLSDLRGVKAPEGAVVPQAPEAKGAYNITAQAVTFRDPKPFMMPKTDGWTKAQWVAQLKKLGFDHTAPVPIGRATQRRLGIAEAEVSSALTFTSARIDGWAYTGLQQVGVDAVAIKKLPPAQQAVEIAKVNRMMDLVDEYIVAAGTKEGLIERLKQVQRPKPEIEKSPKLLSAAIEGLGVDVKSLPNLGQTDFESIDWVQVKLKTDMGAPWPAGQKREPPLIAQARDISIEILLAAGQSADKWTAYVKDHPEFFVLRMKNKFEMMERVDILRKVRPYYVVGTHLFLLFASFVRPVEIQMKMFYQDPLSHSAYKFSWFGGGALQLCQFLAGKLKRAEKLKEFDWLDFGDDQLVVLRIGGKIYVSSPDISAMDMCLGRNWVSVLFAAYVKMYEGKLSLAWSRMVELYATMMTRATVAVHGGVTVFKKSGWHSGFSGITSAEMIVLNYFYESALPAVAEMLKTGKASPDAVSALLLKQAEKMGLHFKKGLQFKEWKWTATGGPDNEKVSQWAFLGYRVAKCTLETAGTKQTLMYPAFNEKLIPSFVYPKQMGEKLTAKQKEQVLKARAFGLWVAGGYLDEVMRRTLKFRYDQYQQSGIRMAETEDIAGFDLPWKEIKSREMDPELPEPHKLRALFAGVGVKKFSDILEWPAGSAQADAKSVASTPAPAGAPLVYESMSLDAKEFGLEPSTGSAGTAAAPAPSPRPKKGGKAAQVKETGSAGASSSSSDGKVWVRETPDTKPDPSKTHMKVRVKEPSLLDDAKAFGTTPVAATPSASSSSRDTNVMSTDKSGSVKPKADAKTSKKKDKTPRDAKKKKGSSEKPVIREPTKSAADAAREYKAKKEAEKAEETKKKKVKEEEVSMNPPKPPSRSWADETVGAGMGVPVAPPASTTGTGLPVGANNTFQTQPHPLDKKVHDAKHQQLLESAAKKREAMQSRVGAKQGQLRAAKSGQVEEDWDPEEEEGDDDGNQQADDLQEHNWSDEDDDEEEDDDHKESSTDSEREDEFHDAREN